MRQFQHGSDLQQFLREQKGTTVGFVPTMGALHAGHISLVEQARAECDVVVVSIFVNPTQFNDPTDLKNYPRTESADLRMLEAAGVDAVYLPAVEDIYPEPDRRVFDFGDLDSVMEGATRPGHFNGVAQVVSRLFEIVAPHKAYFGQKDFQQVAVIRALVAKLGIGVEIVTCPTVREQSGLAMSSRNTLLTAECRDAAPLIYQALCKAVMMKPDATPTQVVDWVRETIDQNENLKVIYFQIVDSATLQPIGAWSETTRPHGCIAVSAGAIRLIDNISFI